MNDDFPKTVNASCPQCKLGFTLDCSTEIAAVHCSRCGTHWTVEIAALRRDSGLFLHFLNYTAGPTPQCKLCQKFD
jgi:transcription elongation factor Elf1